MMSEFKEVAEETCVLFGHLWSPDGPFDDRCRRCGVSRRGKDAEQPDCAVQWVPVVYADELRECLHCHEKWCRKCEKHYHECDCVGPTQDGYEYQVVDGVMMARKEA